MTKDQKIKLLTGATAAEVRRTDEHFFGFIEVNEALAEHWLNHPDVTIGVTRDGHLWILNGGFACPEMDTRYIFADTRLAVIAD